MEEKIKRWIIRAKLILSLALILFFFELADIIFFTLANVSFGISRIHPYLAIFSTLCLLGLVITALAAIRYQGPEKTEGG